MRAHLKAAAASGLAALATLAGGVARVKLQAVYLGAGGLGVIAQVQNLQNALAVLAMLGLGIGISREIARARSAGDAATVRLTFATARALAGGTAIVLAAAAVAAAGPLAMALLGDAGAARWLRLAAPALIFLTLGRVMWEALNGHAEYRLTSAATVTSSVLSVAVLAPLVIRSGLAGAVLALPLAAIGSWAVLGFLFRRSHPELGGAGLRPDPVRASVLLRIGGAALAAAAADEAALLAVRARLIALHGVEANGLFQGAWGLSQHLLNAATVFVGSYPVARLHEARDGEAMRAETAKTLRVTLLMMTPLAAALILFREPLVRIFLAPEFHAALPLFPWQAAGILLRAAGLALGVAVLARAPLRSWLAVGLTGSLGLVAAFLLLQPALGVRAAPAAYALAGAAQVAVAATALGRRRGLPRDRRAGVLAAASAGWIGAAVLLDGATWLGLPAGAWLLPAWAAAAVRPRELREILRLAAGRLRRH
jgi:O-antigen/teichoic acid export membrane protein